jgi:hypothetical protein
MAPAFRARTQGSRFVKHLSVLTATALGVVAILSSSVAHAQGTDELGAFGGLEDRSARRSPQEWAFEIRFGQYPPRVDNSLAGDPHRTIFGRKKRWQGGAELDWQVFRIPKLLSVGPGLGFAYTNASARAPLASGSALSAQDTTLHVLPFFLVGVLRLDVIADRTLIPLAPYAKLGAGYAFWWSSDGDEPARDGNLVAKDTSYGYAAAVGVMFRLDWLDPSDAATADASLGLNHSGLFIEWMHSDLSGFGSGSVMDVGSSTWVAGLTLEL